MELTQPIEEVSKPIEEVKEQPPIDTIPVLQ